MQAPNLPFVIGHRGAAGLAPENTVAGIRRAAREGATWVEFDVKLSRDGVPILFHDDVLTRTTDGRGRIADHFVADIAKLDAGSWFGAEFAGEPVPTLAAVIGVLAELGMGANIEIKPTAGMAVETTRAVGQLLGESWPASLPAPFISSFSRDAMRTARDTLGDLHRAMLFYKLPKDWKKTVKDTACAAVHMQDKHVNQRCIEEVLSAGLPLRIFTVNDPARAKALRDMGIGTVITDRPDLIKA